MSGVKIFMGARTDLEFPNKPNDDGQVPSRRWLNKTIIGIGIASLCSDVGHEMATTAMPVFLASLGASSAALGLIEGVSDGLSSFTKLFSGLYSDRLKRRKPLAVIGYVLTALGTGSFALASHWGHVLLGRAVAWFGRGARTPVRNVLLTEATTPETYGRAFGLERALDSAGAVIGPVLAIFLIAAVGVRGLFLLALIPGFAAALAIWLLVRESPNHQRNDQRFWANLIGLPLPFRRYLLGVGIAGIGDFSNTLLILWATQAWTPRYGLVEAGRMAMLFYVGYNVIYMLSSYASGILADRFPKHIVLSVGYSIAVIPALVLIVPGASLAKFAVVFAFSGVYMGVWETLESTTAATLLQRENRGAGFGTLATVNGIGDFLSSIVVGTLWVVSPAASMCAVMFSSLTGAAVIYITGSRTE